MASKQERVFTDEEVLLLNEMVGIAVRILRNKEVSVEQPEFQERKKEAINIVFGLMEIFSKQDQERMWPSLARRIERTMEIPPEEHFRRKRTRELKASIGEPDDEKTRELLDKVSGTISTMVKRGKVSAAIIRDAVYQTLRGHKYSSKKIKEAKAGALKYYLCAKYGISTSDPDLKSISSPSRQKDLF